MSPCPSIRHALTPLGSRAREERGQALVEFAVVLPVLILLILGIIYFGQFENQASQLTSVAEQAARYAAVNSNPSTSQTLQAYMAAQGPSGTNVSISCTPVVSCAASALTGNPVITACVWANVTSPIAVFTSGQIVQKATMRVETLPFTAWSATNNASGAPC